MNILLVSFDKSLVNKLKETLKEYNVLDVKNGEEAVNTVSSFMDVIIYDAVAASISEEDINRMYNQKFKDAKYIILVDEIFPVDMENITPPKKLKLSRDEAVDKIRDAIIMDAESMPKQEESVPEQEVLPQEEEIVLEKFFFEPEEPEPIPISEEPPPEVSFEEEKLTERKKLMVVSFDNNLVNKLRKALSSEADVVEVKNMREIMEKAKEADLIVFDTILGTLARRTLIDMSNKEELVEKPYILLVDEIFSIELEDIPLKKKYTFARDAELDTAIQKALELLREAPTQLSTEEELALEEALPSSSHEEPIMDLLDSVIESQILQKETTPEEVLQLEELTPTEESKLIEEILALEETPPPQEAPPPQEETIPEQAPQPREVGDVIENLSLVLSDAIKSQLSQEKLLSVLSQVISQEEIKKHLSRKLEEVITEAIREQVRDVFLSVDIVQIVREEAYRVLKERLKELIT
ncbi:MAG: hypothetical protein NZM36_02795 [Aquificaceae bacterium]|nr:hypothetical protein [Aquificaceae bacterium]